MVLVMGLALLDVTAVLSARTQAQTAADAAALAAAPVTFTASLAPRAAARQMAEANGARLVWCKCRVDRRVRSRIASVQTEVSVRLWLWDDVAVFARAQAEFNPYPEN